MFGRWSKSKQPEAAAAAVAPANDPVAGAPASKGVRALFSEFRLVPFFTLASLAAFALVAAALLYFERQEASFFKQVQEGQSAFFKQVQAGFAKQQGDAARRDLLHVHEAGNVNLTRLFANALWVGQFAPFVAKAQQVPVDACRAIADVPDASGKKMVAPPEKKACYEGVGKTIMAFKEFPALDAKVYDSMKKSTVFKIKVFDTRGITVYSSEHKQIGEDKATNAGWKSAMAGKPASELTHRDKFSAFEGVVENRDLISSYLPVYAPGSEEIVGVFEIYSDVTPFLARINDTSKDIAKLAAENERRIAQAAAENTRTVDANANQLLAVVFGLLVALYLGLFLIVRHAQALIGRQRDEREQSQQRLAQSEKMASLGQMVAGVAHQLNTPLAFSKSNVSLVMDQLQSIETPVMVANKLTELVRRSQSDRVVLNLGRSRSQVESIDATREDVAAMREMLGDVLHGIEQMSELVVQMRNFTRLDRATVSSYDLNQGLRTVVYIARSVIPNRVQVEEDYSDVPPVVCNPSQLNQVFLNLIVNASQAIEGIGTITVRTLAVGDQVGVQVTDTGHGIAPEVLPRIFESYFSTKSGGDNTGLGLTIALDIVRSHGGDIQVASEVGRGTTFTVTLPMQAALAKAA